MWHLYFILRDWNWLPDFFEQKAELRYNLALVGRSVTSLCVWLSEVGESSRSTLVWRAFPAMH